MSARAAALRAKAVGWNLVGASRRPFERSVYIVRCLKVGFPLAYGGRVGRCHVHVTQALSLADRGRTGGHLDAVGCRFRY